MRRNPIYVFKDLGSIGIYNVPLNATIQIQDADGNGNPKSVQLSDKSNLGPSSTIGDFLSNEANYKETGSLDFVKIEAVGAANGVAPLDENVKIPGSMIPSMALNDVYVVNSEAEMLALEARAGDVAVRADISKTFIYNGDGTGTVSDWIEVLAPLNGVQVVNGKTGNVTLNTDDISEGLTNKYFTSAYFLNEFRTTSIGELVDVNGGITPAANQALIYNGSNWAPTTIPYPVTAVNTKTGDVVLNTDDIAQGSTNLYFTDARADLRVQAAIDDTAGVTDTNKLWSADKITNALSYKADITYVDTQVGLKQDDLGYGTSNQVVAMNNAGDAIVWADPYDDSGLDTRVTNIEQTIPTLMVTATYDADGNGTVDNAEKVNGLTVETAVPAGAVFTDTVYTDAMADTRANAAIAAASIDALADVDTTTTAPANGQVLGFDGSNWIPINTGTGDGDMLASVYDVNGNGVVDNAERVNGLTVETAVPAGAVFTDTDTTYTAGTGLSLTGTTFALSAAAGDLNDVSTTGAVSGQVLKFNGTTWVPGDDNDTTYDKTAIDAMGIDAATVNGHSVNENVPTGAVFTDTTYTVGDGGLTEINFTTAKDTKLGYITVTGAVDLDQMATDVTANNAKVGYTDAAVDARIGAASVGALADVDTTGATSGQVLKWDGSNWAPSSDIDTTVATLGAVGDVDVTGVTDGQVIKWDAGNSQWIAANDTDTTYTVGDGGLTEINFTTAKDTKLGYITVTGAVDLDQMATDVTANNAKVGYTDAAVDARIGAASVGALADVDTTGATSGQVLKWDGSNWAPADDTDTDTTYTAGTGLLLTGTTFSLDSGISGLADVDTTGAASGDLLRFNGTNWVKITEKASDFTAAASQTDFVVTGEIFSTAKVYQNGVLLRDTDYSIADDGTDTTVTLGTAATSGDWVRVEYTV